MRVFFILIFFKPCKTFGQRSLNGQKKILMLHIAMILIFIIIKGASFYWGNLLEQKWEMGNEWGIILYVQQMGSD